MAALKEIDNSLVTVGSPAEGGCCWTSFNPAAKTPTDATTKMSTVGDFESLGELSENGFSEDKSITSTKHKGWHGSVVLSVVSEEERKYKVEFIEVNRPSVAKLRYGSKNVTAGEDGSVSKILDKVGVNETYPLVFDELESNGYLRRTVVEKAAVESFDTVPHKKGDLLVYGMTFIALDSGDGMPVKIYRAKPAMAAAAAKN
ncbi:MAG: hypothetical protein Q4B35_06435 [Slackia sp.]|nr:hypothetical protein [Slackia sp.]